jgi:hypothetical protein
VEVVSCSEKVKDGRTVRQMLIDTYAEDQKKIAAEKERSNDDAEAKSLNDMKHGSKFVTPFWEQTWILGKRTFKQRRHDILSWEKIILIGLLSVLSGLLWLQMDKDGTTAIPFNIQFIHLVTLTNLPPQFAEGSLGDRAGFLFFSSMFWIMHTWFNSLFACT